jgi:hypothetical protein
MNLKLYGTQGRIVSGIAGFAGVLAAIVSAAQQANLVSIFPPSANKYFTAAAVVSLFVTMFSERLQGGASKSDVRVAAQKADDKKLLDKINEQ